MQGRRLGPRSTDQYLKQHVYMAVGWNHEIHARSDGARGGIWMNEVLPENVTAEDGWLYAEYQINDDSWVEQAYGDGTTLPTTWQGLSGGAVWHVWRPDSAEDRYEKMLVGVPFYEIRQPVERSMTIRVHHDLSLLRLLHRAGIAPPDAITDEEIASGLRAVAAPSQASASEPLISGLGGHCSIQIPGRRCHRLGGTAASTRNRSRPAHRKEEHHDSRHVEGRRQRSTACPDRQESPGEQDARIQRKGSWQGR